MRLLTFPDPIITERLSIQLLRYEDAEEIFYTYASRPEATPYVTWSTHRSVNDTRSFLEYATAASAKGTDYSFGIRSRSDNRLIGGFGVQNENGRVSIGYILGPVHWRRGYATEACVGMVKHIVSFDSVYRIQSFVDLDNQPSMSVLGKAGFVEEARLKHFYRFVNQGNQPKDCALFYYPQMAGR